MKTRRYDYHFWYRTSNGVWANKSSSLPSATLGSDLPTMSDSPNWVKLKDADGIENFVQREINVNSQETYFAFADNNLAAGTQYRVSFIGFRANSRNFSQYAEIYL